MPKLGPISVDDRVLRAIRDDRLVVFAGAGVSMGPPANLPDFPKLALDIAEGSVASKGTEPLDRFLGQVAHSGVNVHARAHAILSRGGGAPTQLHSDLLRLFQTAERVRLVTTNFDLHFETAAQALFGKSPAVFKAPALPRGRSFQGLVHLHGSLSEPAAMVLTDSDFGKAYLTEGWARRFLVDAFRSYTVLFVGYSHNDVVMNYLARALPAEDLAGRFALTELEGDWKLLGIEPVAFRKGAGSNAFQELYDGIAVLSERASRGALEWRTKLAEIASRAPPADEETAGEIEQALREIHTTKFFVDSARHPDWLAWLDARGQLDALFDQKALGPAGNLLCAWVANHYAHEHAETCFRLLARHRMQMSPSLWRSLALAIGLEKEKSSSPEALRRWVATLLDASPIEADSHMLGWLLAKCAEHGDARLALEVFMRMAADRISIEVGVRFPTDTSDGEAPAPLEQKVRAASQHFPLREAWQKSLKPQIDKIAALLLSSVVRQWQGTHARLTAWSKVNRDWDARSYGRSAIEQHEQDRYEEPEDVLIDAARDALEWFSKHDLVKLDSWISTLADDDVPLLRRLAIHCVTEHPRLTADQKIEWLLVNAALYGDAEHHEIFRCARAAFPSAGETAQRQLIQKIVAFKLKIEEDDRAEERTDRLHFNWLCWLEQSAPACPLLAAELVPLRAKHPSWRLTEHPDLTHWVGSAHSHSPASPKTAAELEASSPSDLLEFLLTFDGDWFNGPDRSGLLGAVREVCNRNSAWTLQLAEALEARSEWKSDLWQTVFWSWREIAMTAEQWRGVLARVSRRELWTAHQRDVVEILNDLVAKGGKPFAVELLAVANVLAENLWKSIEDHYEASEPEDWLGRAINQPAGRLTEFWVHGLSQSLVGKAGVDRSLPDDYRRWLTEVVDNPHDAGGLGRSILARQMSFLFHLDPAWTSAHIVPLLSETDPKKFAQGWDGFLYGRLSTELVQVLLPAFEGAIPRILEGPESDRRRHFIELIAALATFHLSEPNALLRQFLRNGTPQDRAAVVGKIGWNLRNLGSATAQRLWLQWLQQYWEDRLQSMPVLLEVGEVAELIEWVPVLGDAFPSAVAIANRSPRVALEHTQVMYELDQSDLPDRFPSDCAEFLIYLCESDLGYHNGDVRKINARLLDLDGGLRRRLDEAMARVGL